MPRYVLKKAPKSPDHEKLVRRLAQELKSPGSDLQPLILEQEIEATDSRHVHVIWNRWKNVAEEQRSDIIWDAYAEVEGVEAVEDIALASGVTPEEAVVLGLLPFKVTSTRKRHEAKPPAAKYKKGLEAEARNTVLGAGANELRYARLEDAEDAKKRLESAVPGSEWAVVHEVPYES